MAKFFHVGTSPDNGTCCNDLANCLAAEKITVKIKEL